MIDGYSFRRTGHGFVKDLRWYNGKLQMPVTMHGDEVWKNIPIVQTVKKGKAEDHKVEEDANI